jgi:hypothetical protein
MILPWSRPASSTGIRAQLVGPVEQLVEQLTRELLGLDDVAQARA